MNFFQSPYDGDRLIVEQLSKDHKTSNDEELRRLAECGLDPTMLRRSKRLGYQQNTRSIGDYSIKGGYADVDSIRLACLLKEIVYALCVCVGESERRL